MSDVSEGLRQVAQAASAAFGGRPQVNRYWDDAHAAHVDVVCCEGSPWKGANSYSTVGVSEVPLRLEGRELRARAELVGACAASAGRFPHILVAAALRVIQLGWPVAPGVIFADILPGESSTMAHLLFVPPFLWDDRLRTLTVGDRSVGWLLAIPISDGERRFALSQGVPALETLFERHQIDTLDLNRVSVAG